MSLRRTIALSTLVALLALQALASFPGSVAQAYDPTQDSSNCTWWIWQKRPDIPVNLGNALEWGTNARERGFPTGTAPARRAVAVFQPGVQGAWSTGHVAYVEEVYSAESFLVSEHGWGPDPTVTNYRTASADPAIGSDGRPDVEFIYAPDSLPDDITYSAHAAMLGWLDPVRGGDTAGITGMALSVEAVKIQLGPGSAGAHLRYQAHVQNLGWLDWVSDGAVGGTTGQALRMEAIRIIIDNAPPDLHVEYRAHVEGYGWLNTAPTWRATAGSTGSAMGHCPAPPAAGFGWRLCRFVWFGSQ
ncbi:MAG: CHAP domain-containing protein [Chloroflexi bacterium]|nr:CHAP domain-containing protein [Chloroflexota bacterium]